MREKYVNQTEAEAKELVIVYHYLSPGGGVGGFWMCHDKIYRLSPKGSVIFL